jgi:predicted regulator of Ras-like GTPase activity (Roadblock/LC7/MglB family)
LQIIDPRRFSLGVSGPKVISDVDTDMAHERKGIDGASLRSPTALSGLCDFSKIHPWAIDMSASFSIHRADSQLHIPPNPSDGIHIRAWLRATDERGQSMDSRATKINVLVHVTFFRRPVEWKGFMYHCPSRCVGFLIQYFLDLRNADVDDFRSHYCARLLFMGESAEILERIGSQPGVLGTLVMSNTGIPVTTTFSAVDAALYAALVADFTKKVQTCASALVEGQALQVFRVRSFKNELIVIPHTHLTLVIVQDAVVAV